MRNALILPASILWTRDELTDYPIAWIGDTEITWAEARRMITAGLARTAREGSA